MFVAAAGMLFRSVGYGQSDPPAANSGGLNFKQFGLLAIQDGGRRKPIDTFARETLIRITGRSTYTDKAGRKWQPNDFVLSALLETHDWKNEPMVLISLGQLIEQLGLDKTQRRFPFAQLTGSAELQRIASEARALKRAEKPLDRVQQESLSVSDRLALLGNVMNGNALLIVPSPQRETDAWLVPDPTAVAAYYNETQFAPAFAELTKMMRAYTQADAFNFSIGQFTSAQSLDLSAGTTTATRVFLQSFRRILSRDLVLRDRPRNFNRGASAQAGTRVAERRRGDCASGSRVSRKWNCDALSDRWPPASHEHV